MSTVGLSSHREWKMMAGIFALADVWASVFWLYHNVFAHPFSKYTVNTYARVLSKR